MVKIALTSFALITSKPMTMPSIRPSIQNSLTLFAFIAFAQSLGCIKRSEEQVVIYCSVDREFASPILDAYERNNAPIEVAAQFDVESTKAVGLANRIVAEAETPRCDVFWNGEVLQTIRLQKLGLLQKHAYDFPDGFRRHLTASDGTWAPITARARVLLVNTDKLGDELKWPTKVEDLADPQWKGQCGIASPLFGTTSTHMAVLKSQNKASYRDWIVKVKENAIVLSGNKQIAQAVSRGDLTWGLTDTDDALIERDNGGHVAIVFPDQAEKGVGTLLIPSTVAILKDSPHPVAARNLANHLFSKETASRLTMGAAAQFNLWPAAKLSDHFEDAESLKLMEVDFEKAGDIWQETISELETIFRG